MGGGETEWKRNTNREGEGHLGWLNIYVSDCWMYHMHVQLSHTVGCPAQTDAGLKVLLFTTTFLLSFPLCFLASSVWLSRRWTPSYASWACDAWPIWMGWQGEGSVSGFYRGWRWRWVRTQQAVLGDCMWLFFLFLSGHQVVCCLVPPAHLECHSDSPGQSHSATQNTYKGWHGGRHVGDNKVDKQAF